MARHEAKRALAIARCSEGAVRPNHRELCPQRAAPPGSACRAHDDVQAPERRELSVPRTVANT